MHQSCLPQQVCFCASNHAGRGAATHPLLPGLAVRGGGRSHSGQYKYSDTHLPSGTSGAQVVFVVFAVFLLLLSMLSMGTREEWMEEEEEEEEEEKTEMK
ncbi:hypothetical protein E2C01_099396 [Portunus trituberculatus]|uniref:Uncharacterized protein n=1 Tax=Portunus trituberculatus TaxID=210409 RepID=A0A5B7KGR7_PORTR|nr:hypothetical protein [Portunus trituberculatus]